MILHVGAVLVGIFLIQLMFGFGRYYCRLAAHLRMTGTLMLAADGDAAVLTSLAGTLLPTDLEFGKVPRSPVERVLVAAAEAVREAAKLPPSK